MNMKVGAGNATQVWLPENRTGQAGAVAQFKLGQVSVRMDRDLHP